jgi:patatin-like phospholipase/acyl hydrolase
MSNKIIRILSLDGGGIRGIFSATFLEKFCNDAGIQGNELWKYFDIICGTSIGGIQAIAYSLALSPTDVINLLTNNATSIFTIRAGVNPLQPLGPAGAATLGTVLAVPGVEPYIYNQQPLRDALSPILGNTKMFQLKTNTLVTAVGFKGGTGPSSDNINFPYGDITSRQYYHFSNILIPDFTTGQNYTCIDVAIATGSAPVYFRPTLIQGVSSDTFFIDGGLYQNNPTALGYLFSNILFSQNVKTCILSVGTGYSDPDIEITTTSNNLRAAPNNGLGLLANCLNLTLNGATDAVETQFKLMSLYKGATNNLFHYRFQRFLADQELSKLDNPTSEAIAYLKSQANLQYGQDAIKIQQFIQKCNF